MPICARISNLLRFGIRYFYGIFYISLLPSKVPTLVSMNIHFVSGNGVGLWAVRFGLGMLFPQ
jgi:hypothetical protein